MIYLFEISKIKKKRKKHLKASYEFCYCKVCCTRGRPAVLLSCWHENILEKYKVTFNQQHYIRSSSKSIQIHNLNMEMRDDEGIVKRFWQGCGGNKNTCSLNTHVQSGCHRVTNVKIIPQLPIWLPRWEGCCAVGQESSQEDEWMWWEKSTDSGWNVCSTHSGSWSYEYVCVSVCAWVCREGWTPNPMYHILFPA